mgnify:CR=1 FL=1
MLLLLIKILLFRLRRLENDPVQGLVRMEGGQILEPNRFLQHVSATENEKYHLKVYPFVTSK